MKTFLFRNTLLIVCLLAAATTRAATLKSTYIGPIEGNWGDSANWSPPVVPNNSGSDTFAVRIANVFLTLDLDVAVNRITFAPGDSVFDGGPAPLLLCIDHDFSSLQTKVGVGGFPYFFADTKDVTGDLGDLADFSGTTLKTGYAYGVAASAGRTATLKFNGANIVKSNAGIELIGAGTSIVDENGRDALEHFRHNLLFGYFDLEVGRDFTTEGSFVNEGEVVVFASDPSSIDGDVTTTLTINGKYTGIGFPPDGTLGKVTAIAPGPLGDARVVIKGRLTNYEAASRTLHKTTYQWQAARGRSATTQVLGRGPFEIVTSEASLALFGPNTGFRDRFGDDALRNLSTSARMLIGDRDFTTAGSFTSTSRFSIFGDTQFIVNGDLTIEAGVFDLSPLTGYAAIGDPGFPLDPAYVDSNVLVDGNFTLTAASMLRLDFYDTAITATVTVNGTAVFAGTLEAAVEDVSLLTSSDTFTVLTASQITGQFSNVPSGGRVDAYLDPNGDPIGSFLVTYDNTTLVLSDFQPAGDAGERRKPARGRSWLERRSSPDRGNE